jgi:hypothetical protein
MFGLSSCTTSILLIAALFLLAGFLFVIVGLGGHRLVREAGSNHSVMLVPLNLYRTGHYGAKHEVPRSRLAGLNNVALVILIIAILCLFARSPTC